MYTIEWKRLPYIGVDYAVKHLSTLLNNAVELKPRFFCACVTIGQGGWVTASTYVVAFDTRFIEPYAVRAELHRMFGFYEISRVGNIVVVGINGPSDTVKSPDNLEQVLNKVAKQPGVLIG